MDKDRGRAGSRSAGRSSDDSDEYLREFTFTDADFERICKLIYRTAGIALGSNKKSMVYSRLSRRLRATGIKTFHQYLERLDQGDLQEWEAFTNALTTNLTAFFREPHHFPVLCEHVRRIGREPVKIWSCASSTGEEPYSIAMTMVDLFANFHPPATILATDVDTSVLARAQSGIYALEKIEKLDAQTVKRFFLRGTGKHEGQVKIRPELRDMISFQPHNLLHASWTVGGPYDAIFCRNVMIYFDKNTQYQILEKFSRLLHPDGLLFAGHAESFFHATDLFTSCGKTVYRLSKSRPAPQKTSARAPA